MLQGYQPSALSGGRGQVFCANALVTPSLFSTAAAMSGPLLWNGSAVGGGKGVTAYVLAVSYGLVVASTVAGAIGLTGAAGQPAAPTSTTAIGITGNLYVGGPAPACTAYAVGTVVNAGTFFLPTGGVGTGATTVQTTDDNIINVGGAVVVPISAWAAVAGSAILTTSTIQVGLVWLEVPN